MQKEERLKKEEVITFTIIFLIIFMEIVFQKFTKKAIQDSTGDLESLKNEIIRVCSENEDFEIADENEKENIINSMQNARDKWENSVRQLEYFISYDELDNVKSKMDLTMTELEIDSYDDSVKDLEESIHSLEEIQEKYKFKIKTIL